MPPIYMDEWKYFDRRDARIEELIAGSDRVDRNDPAWQATARHRRWLRHWPGVLSV
jgi:hypothetical protein